MVGALHGTIRSKLITSIQYGLLLPGITTGPAASICCYQDFPPVMSPNLPSSLLSCFCRYFVTVLRMLKDANSLRDPRSSPRALPLKGFAAS